MGEHYPDFPHHSEIKQFLNEYADRFSLHDRIKFQTRVQRAQARSLDDEEEADELSPEERRQALTALASAGLAQPGSEAGTAPRKPAGSGWDRVRRSAATQRKEA